MSTSHMLNRNRRRTSFASNSVLSTYLFQQIRTKCSERLVSSTDELLLVVTSVSRMSAMRCVVYVTSVSRVSAMRCVVYA